MHTIDDNPDKTPQHVYGQPTKIPPIQCAPWCTDGDGHVKSATSRDDQNCWGEDHIVELSLEEVHASPLRNRASTQSTSPS